MEAKDWYIFKGPNGKKEELPKAPPWRTFNGELRTVKTTERGQLPKQSPEEQRRGSLYQAEPLEIEMVNAALMLRRPLLVTGKPGTGKSTLAYAVAQDLNLGPVLRWSITSRSTLRDGLYSYDILGRLQEQQLNPNKPPDISPYLRLGPLGTALVPAPRPRVLLIDEVDKCDIDLPNDLLHIFEEGGFEIPELARLPDGEKPVEVRAHDEGFWVPIVGGKITCKEFPFVILTSNGEREFPPAFMRRCIRLTLPEPSTDKLTAIIDAHLGEQTSTEELKQQATLVANFEMRRRTHDLSTDQLLSALYLRIVGTPLDLNTEEGRRLHDALLKPLTGGQAT